MLDDITPQTPPPNSPPAGSALTPSALRARSLRRTLTALIGVVLVVGGLFYWLQIRQDQAASVKRERGRAHVLLKPNEESQDWRLKEGARVEELATTIDHLRRDTTDMKSQLEELQKRTRTAAGRGVTSDAPEESTRPPQRGRTASNAVPPLPPLHQILPPGSGENPAESDRRPSRPGRAPGRERGPVSAQAPSSSSEGREPDFGPPASTHAGQPSLSSGPSTDRGGASGIEHVIVSPGRTVTDAKTPSAARERQSQASHPPAPSQPKMRVILPSPSADQRERKPTQPVGWLPSGSFVRATLLSGVDAGTGTGSNLPYPVLMRLTDPGTLPNRYQMDLAECFVVGAAWGDLPSERVYIRSENLSCIRRHSSDLITIDGDLKAQVMGEDGKLGIRGRVVSKQGTIIARSLWAGFISGLSQAFRPRISFAPLTLTGDPGSGQAFSLPPLSDTLAAAGISGVGKSMDLVANFYLKQAQNLFPVIEIDSGRTVDLVILKGMPLKFNVQHTAGSTAQQEVID